MKTSPLLWFVRKMNVTELGLSAFAKELQLEEIKFFDNSWRGFKQFER